jgi:hypothetical protein
MAENIQRPDSTEASYVGWELAEIEPKKDELIAKLIARVAALETENKLLKEKKGLLFS